MEMPIKTFWAMVHNINRVTAGDELRKTMMLAASQAGPEDQKEYRESLSKEVGTVITTKIDLDAKPDEEGVGFLKGLAGA